VALKCKQEAIRTFYGASTPWSNGVGHGKETGKGAEKKKIMEATDQEAEDNKKKIHRIIMIAVNR
jgi:hypothetical protein